MAASGKLLLIDVMPLLYRGHFAFASRPRLTSAGINTSAIFLFAMSVQQMISEEGVTHVALAMDVSPTFRHERYPEYKAQREKMPEDIAASIPMAEEFAAAMRIPFLRVPGFEADDVIGTLAARADAAGMSVRIFTPDKDFAQLVTERVTLSRPAKGDNGTDDYTPQQVREHWGVPSPAQIIDLLALEGDAVDNIPGVPGVGEKTASRLLQEYGSLEGVLAHADEVKGKLGERLREHADDARLSYWLATISRDAPVPGGLDEYRLQAPDMDAVTAFLTKYELFALRKKFGLSAKASEASDGLPLFGGPGVTGSFTKPKNEAPAPLGDLFAFFGEAPKPVENVPEGTIGCDVDEAVSALSGVNSFAFALEYNGDAMVAVSVAVGEGEAFREWRFANGGKAEWTRLGTVFGREGIAKVGHDVKRAMVALSRHGVSLAGPVHDLMLAHYVLDSAARHGLDALKAAFLQGNVFGKTRAATVLALQQPLWKAVREAGAWDALSRCEDPLVPILFEMEREGIRLDVDVLRAYSGELSRSIAELEQRIYAIAREAQAPVAPAENTLFGALGLTTEATPALDLASARQLGKLLFETLGLPSAGKTATGQYDTSEEVLQGLATQHPVVPLILEWKAQTKLKSTYVDKLPGCVDPADGRIHTTFQQALTETGRLSSDNPNLQNIPIRTELGQRIRAAFVARDEGHVLLSADYSQIELRVLASLSGDEAMAEDFRKGSDIHAETAGRVHQIPSSEVTSQMRSQAKRVNFGIVYGISAFGLAQRLGIPRKQASELIAAVKAAYPGIERFMQQAVEEARTTGCAKTLMGRRRPIRDIASRNGTQRAAAERLAVNTPVQGSAADIVKLAMVAIQNELHSRHLRTRMVLQIHDELVFDVPLDEVELVSSVVQQAMESVLPLSVPLAVEIGYGKTWLDAH